MLAVDVARTRGDFTLELALEVAAGSTLVLAGESGAGKTTLLQMIAGLLVPDRGRIALDGRVLAEPAAGIATPARERPVGYVPQDLALFPHLSARDNVAFGLEAAGTSRARARARADDALARFGIAALALRRPVELSGGEQQRVAIARALAREPRVLLLDEPFAALDPATRRAARAELRRALASTSCTTMFVTHNPIEALVFGDRIAVLENGRVTQIGPRDDLIAHPRSAYVAEFLGVNRLEGQVTGRPVPGLALVAAEGGKITIADPGHDGRVGLIVHPREITLSLAPPEGSARNVLEGAIEELYPEPPRGEHVRVVIATTPRLAAQITRAAADSLRLRPGLRVYASFKASGVVTLPV